MQFVVVFLNERRYAFPLGDVERIVAAVQVAPLPGTPATVLGAIWVWAAATPGEGGAPLYFTLPPERRQTKPSASP